MKALITGGGGFIGSHLTRALIERGDTVAVMDDLSSGSKENIPRGVKFYWADVTADTALRIVMANWRPEVIFHLAAQPSLRVSMEAPEKDAKVNVMGTLNIITYARLFDVEHVVFSSTSAVYDPNGLIPFVEDDECNPVAPYGIAKRASELYLAACFPKSAVLRYGNVYGPGQVAIGENQLVPRCLGWLSRGDKFVINGDGKQSRDFVYVDDITRANIMAAEARVCGVFNAGTGRGTSVEWMVDALRQMWGAAAGPERGPAVGGEIRHVALNSEKAFESFGWKAEVGPEEGLERTVRSWRSPR